jgi:hypothetical protein
VRLPLGNLVRSFATSLAEHVMAGTPETPADKRAARLTVCESCDKLTPGWQCSMCGCRVAIKAGWAEQKCPLGKWR